MNALIKTAAFAVTAALCAMLVQAHQQQAGKAVRLCASVMLLFAALHHLEPVVQALQQFADSAGLSQSTLSLLFRLIAMAYLTEFAVQFCRDAGEDGLAQKAALTGKMLLAAQTVPLLDTIGRTALSFLP